LPHVIKPVLLLWKYLINDIVVSIFKIQIIFSRKSFLLNGHKIWNRCLKKIQKKLTSFQTNCVCSTSKKTKQIPEIIFALINITSTELLIYWTLFFQKLYLQIYEVIYSSHFSLFNWFQLKISINLKKFKIICKKIIGINAKKVKF
jgi:hypothetical protein